MCIPGKLSDLRSRSCTFLPHVDPTRGALTQAYNPGKLGDLRSRSTLLAGQVNSIPVLLLL